jgi:hypothetical protein
MDIVRSVEVPSEEADVEGVQRLALFTEISVGEAP